MYCEISLPARYSQTLHSLPSLFLLLGVLRSVVKANEDTSAEARAAFERTVFLGGTPTINYRAHVCSGIMTRHGGFVTSDMAVCHHELSHTHLSSHNRVTLQGRSPRISCSNICTALNDLGLPAQAEFGLFQSQISGIWSEPGATAPTTTVRHFCNLACRPSPFFAHYRKALSLSKGRPQHRRCKLILLNERRRQCIRMWP